MIAAMMTISAVAQEGTQIQVNTIDYPYVNGPENPSITSLYYGGIVVVWDVPSRDGIYGQLFDYDGSRIGNTFTVIEGTYCKNPVVAAVLDSFVVVWESKVGRRSVLNFTAYDETMFSQVSPDLLVLPEGMFARNPTIVQGGQGFKVVYLAHREDVNGNTHSAAIYSHDIYYSDYIIYKNSENATLLSTFDTTPYREAVPRVSEVAHSRLIGHTWDANGTVIVHFTDWYQNKNFTKIPNAYNPDISDRAVVYQSEGDIYLQIISDEVTDLQPVKVSDGINGQHSHPRVVVSSKYKGSSIVVVVWTVKKRDVNRAVLSRQYNYTNLLPLTEVYVVSDDHTSLKRMPAISRWGDIFEPGSPGYAIVWRSRPHPKTGAIAAKLFPKLPSSETKSPPFVPSNSSQIPIPTGSESLFQIKLKVKRVSYTETAKSITCISDSINKLMLRSKDDLFIDNICLSKLSEVIECRQPTSTTELKGFTLRFVGTSVAGIHWLQETLSLHMTTAIKDCYDKDSNIIVGDMVVVDITVPTLKVISKVGISVAVISGVLVLCIVSGYCYTRSEEKKHMKLKEEGEEEGEEEEGVPEEDVFDAANQELDVIQDYENEDEESKDT